MARFSLPLVLLFAVPMAEAQVTGSSRLLLNRNGESAAWNGVGRLRIGGGCTASFLKPLTGDLPETAPAYVLTAGHCIRLTSQPNEVIVDSPVTSGTFIPSYFVDTQDQQQTFRARRVAYASMKGTDVAIVELDATHAQLAGKGYRPLELSAEQPSAGETVAITGIPSNDIPLEERFLRRVACTQGAPATLVEWIWTFCDFYPNDCADIRGGSSGSPVLSERTGKVVGEVLQPRRRL